MADKPIITTLPSGATNIWSQQNISDIIRTDPVNGIVGNLYSSFNIDLVEKDGKLRVGKKMLINTSTADVATLIGVPVGFRVGPSGKIYTAAGSNGTGYVFNTATPSGAFLTNAFTKNTVTGAPTTLDSFYSDIESLAGSIFVTQNSTTAYWLNTAETTWTSFDIVGGSATAYGVPVMLATYGGRMYATYKGNNIVSWDMSGSSTVPGDFTGAPSSPYVPGISTKGFKTLTLGDFNQTTQILWMRPASDRIWIGTLNTHGGKGYVYSWDGLSATVTASYRMPGAGALSCVVKDDVPWVIDTYGRLLKWNGGTFVAVGQFNMLNNLYLWDPMNPINNRFIHPNGMAIIGNQVSALIDGRNYDGVLGPPMTFSQFDTINSGVWQYDELYGWFHKHSLSTCHSGDPATQDYGQAYLSNDANSAAVGGLSELISSLYVSGSGTDGSFLAGGTFTNDASNASGNTWAIYYDNNLDTVQKAAYFVTQKIPTSGVTDMWQKLFLKHAPLLNSTDRFVVKYRTMDSSFTPIIVKATTTSQVTTTDSNAANFGVGDEVQFVTGTNGGICAHITANSLSGGTYTITLDEPITTTSTRTCRARFQKWTKAKEINDQTSFFAEILLGKASTWIQFKVWMLFTGQNEIEVLNVLSKENQAIQ